MTSRKFKKKIILTEHTIFANNNIPCDDFHLDIIQSIENPAEVIFEYIPPRIYKAKNLKNEDDVNEFINYIGRLGKFLPDNCTKKNFVFKTLYSNLDENEIEILRKTRHRLSKENIMPGIKIDTYLKGLNIFYKTKKEYEDKYRMYKKKIRNTSGLTNQEKNHKMREYKNLCAGCKQKVGMIFINTGRVLKMMCGNKTAPCNLYLEIQKPTIIYMPSEIQKLLKKLELLKQSIIKIKLNYLFQLKDEEEVTELFGRMKQSYNKLNKWLKNLEKKLEEHEQVEERREKVQEEKIKLYEYIKLYSETIKNYEETDQYSNLEEAIEIYLKDVVSINNKIRKLLYTRSTIEKTHEKKKNNFQIGAREKYSSSKGINSRKTQDKKKTII